MMYSSIQCFRLNVDISFRIYALFKLIANN